jgi:dihydroneopterin aldolase
MDSRGDLLRRRAIEALDYQTRLRKEEEDRITREQKPILDRLQGLVEQGELQSARDAARIYAESGMLQEDALRQVLQAARTRQESIEDRELHKRKVEATIKAQEDQAAAARDQARAIKQAYEMLGRHHALTNAADSGNEETVRKWLGQTFIGQGTLENGEGRAALETIISKYKLTPNAAQDLRQNLEEYFPRGYYTRTINGKKERIPIPVALVDLALAATDEIGDGALWSRRGDKARKYIQRALEDPNILNAIKEAVTVRDGRIAVRAQSALDPRALDVGATINTDTLLQLGKWMAPPGNQR